jgi:predicted Rossmann fold flavoprotein
MYNFDVIIIGAGAAGLMCAGVAIKRGRTILVLDHASKVGEKIRISGGGRANFTNLHSSPANFLSSNPQFCISALRRFSQDDFIALVEKHRISYEERDHGQLFCKGSANQITNMLLSESQGSVIQTETNINRISKTQNIFNVETNKGKFTATSLVIATGGPSIPKIGATGFAYQIARQFGLKVIKPRAGLVPLTFNRETLEKLQGLAGISLEAEAKYQNVTFKEGLIFTHRGLSGPAILQISSYWRQNNVIFIDLLPGIDAFEFLNLSKQQNSKKEVSKVLSTLLPKRLSQKIAAWNACERNLAETSDNKIRTLANNINSWILEPNGSEGMRTAEVTIGGIDTKELSSKTMESTNVTGLYFIGEAVDVTGHLGGFNFQWAWSSGHACGQVV